MSTLFVKDISSAINYRPNLDNNDHYECDDCGCKALYPEKLKEESRWEQLAKLKADIDTNLSNDGVVKRGQKLMQVNSLYHDIRDDRNKIIDVCALLDIEVREGSDFDSLRDKIFRRITSDERWANGTYTDLFIDYMLQRGVFVENPIKVRYAHMVDEYASNNVDKDFRKSHGEDWAKKARDYTKVLKMDFHLSDHFSSTLLDENTILIFPRNYKKPEPEKPYWDEEDLVVSQSYFAKENEKSTGIIDFIYHIFT